MFTKQRNNNNTNDSDRKSWNCFHFCVSHSHVITREWLCSEFEHYEKINCRWLSLTLGIGLCEKEKIFSCSYILEAVYVTCYSRMW